jgi:hypothetical protein
MPLYDAGARPDRLGSGCLSATLENLVRRFSGLQKRGQTRRGRSLSTAIKVAGGRSGDEANSCKRTLTTLYQLLTWVQHEKRFWGFALHLTRSRELSSVFPPHRDNPRYVGQVWYIPSRYKLFLSTRCESREIIIRYVSLRCINHSRFAAQMMTSSMPK